MPSLLSSRNREILSGDDLIIMMESAAPVSLHGTTDLPVYKLLHSGHVVPLVLTNEKNRVNWKHLRNREMKMYRQKWIFLLFDIQQ